jgi:hypothetical protein
LPKISQIQGIGKSRLELLETVGYLDVESLSQADPEVLWQEIAKANSMLRLMRATPSKDEVEQWVVAARNMLGDENPTDGPAAIPVNHEENPQLQAVMPLAPFAIPLPARVFVENRVRVAEIPPAILLNRHQGDLDIRTDQWVPQTQSASASAKAPRGVPSAGPSQYVILAEQPESKLDIDTSKVRPLASQAGPRRKIAAVQSESEVTENAVDERLNLLRAPRPETNRGRKPESRLYIRGVLHTHPKSIWFGALITLLTGVWLPVSIVSALLLLLSDQLPASFGWVPSWVILFPTILPLVGLGYLVWGVGGSCRICGQKLFLHRPHRKHIKAHHIRFLGYIVPLCFHILLFRWFRCTHCGTPVRLKE